MKRDRAKLFQYSLRASCKLIREFSLLGAEVVGEFPLYFTVGSSPPFTWETPPIYFLLSAFFDQVALDLLAL